MSIYHDAIKRFGEVTQIFKAAEELAECSAELTKYGIARMLGKKPKNAYALAEELADVEIVLAQMKIALHELNGPKVEWKRKKLARLRQQIDESGEEATPKQSNTDTDPE